MLNEFDRHIEHSELTETTLNFRAVDKLRSVEEVVYEKIRNEQLHNAISELSDTQKRRLILYYFSGLTYEQIAEIEGCRAKSVYLSVVRAKEKNREKIKYF